ncbi:hypothetical protein HK405_006553 [Cladochytrium tenue]|nr:hypothetical protein HK405_006553 [Cladochytrium tenue]
MASPSLAGVMVPIPAATLQALGATGLLSDDAIHRNRLTVETRPLKRVIHRFRALQDAAASSNPEAISTAVADLLVDLDAFEMNLQKQLIVHGVNRQDVEHYEQEKKSIGKAMKQAEADIEELKVQLAEEQQLRRNRQEYDALAAKINELPTREESLSNTAMLEAEISQLRAALERHTVSLERRRELLSVVSREVQGARVAVADDRTEADAQEEARLGASSASTRRAAADAGDAGDADDDDAGDGVVGDDEGAARGVAGAGGGGGTQEDGQAEDGEARPVAVEKKPHEEDEEGAVTEDSAANNAAASAPAAPPTSSRFSRESRMDVDS